MVLVACMSGCGGSGGSSTPTVAVIPTVDSITADKAMYSQLSTITVAGSNLEQGVSAAATGACSSLTELNGGTAAKRMYSCTPATVGSINVTVSSASQAVLKTAAIQVPNPQVTMVTTKGTIVVELNPSKAPISVNNFLVYAHEGFYSSTLFHRVVPGFVVQGGNISAIDGKPKATHNPIVLEPPSVTGLTNAVGTIAMARTKDLNTATSQFFFNTVDNGNKLDAPAGGGYAVFGVVTTGMDIVKLIEATPISDLTPLSSYVAVTSMVQNK